MCDDGADIQVEPETAQLMRWRIQCVSPLITHVGLMGETDSRHVYNETKSVVVV